MFATQKSWRSNNFLELHCKAVTLLVVQKSLLILGSPLIPGHEIIGNIAAVGPGEKTWKVGDRVGAPWHGGHDGTCKQCKRGFNQACVNQQINGITRDGGCKCFVYLFFDLTAVS